MFLVGVECMNETGIFDREQKKKKKNGTDSGKKKNSYKLIINITNVVDRNR